MVPGKYSERRRRQLWFVILRNGWIRQRKDFRDKTAFADENQKITFGNCVRCIALAGSADLGIYKSSAYDGKSANLVRLFAVHIVKLLYVIDVICVSEKKKNF